MVMKFMLLPWKPELVFTGTSVMGINPETGKFCSHVVEFQPYFHREKFAHYNWTARAFNIRAFLVL